MSKKYVIDVDLDDMDKSDKPEKKRSIIGRIIRWFFLLSFLILVSGGISAYFLYRHITSDLPRIFTIEDYHPPIISTVYSDDNRKIAEFYKERRIVIPLTEMPKTLIQAFVSAEDSRFFEHPGVDLISIARAVIKNIEAGKVKQGGSTITQQVTRTFLLTREKTYTRKIKEAVLAYRIDKTFTKEQILFLYLNQIYLGHGAYGVQSAAEVYFGKPAKELTLAECAIIAGLPQAPSKYSPHNHFDKAKERQDYVLNRMVEEKYITIEQAREAFNTKLEIKPTQNLFVEEAPDYSEHVRRYLEEKYGPDKLYKEGLQIYTPVNITMQKTAREELEKGLRDLDKRQGYRGPIKQLKAQEIEPYAAEVQKELDKHPPKEGKIIQGVVVEVNDKKNLVSVRVGNYQGTIPLDDMRWARKPNPDVQFTGRNGISRPSQAVSPGDVIQVKFKEKDGNTDNWKLSLEQVPIVEGALLGIEAGTGLVKTMIGGRDYTKSQFNRAIQSKRQPGSAFKALIYAAAMDKGFTPATVIMDTAFVYDDGSEKLWMPQNYDKKFYGPIPVREALAQSRNLPTIRILEDIGLDYFLEYAKKLGIKADLYNNLSLALGASGLPLIELVRAYSVFVNQGLLIEPIFLTRLVDRYGKEIEKNQAVPKLVIEPNSAYIITSLLQSVVKEGTGKRVLALNRPAAGKTGTTNNLFDAWFIGFTPNFIAGVWVGFDEERPLGAMETGGRAACPIWLGYMQRILENTPVFDFEVPKGVVFSKIDKDTGMLPGPDTQRIMFECFKEGTVPTKISKQPDFITDQEDFFKSDM